ncbi:MAG TPA: hypothetical protein VIV40_12635 [Kofleriaceae bacterium]
MVWSGRAALLLLALAGSSACTKPKSPDATDAECTAYRNKMFAFLPAEEQKSMAGIGLDKPTPKELELCRERMNSDEVACVLKAASMDEALACRSATDDRPAEVKRTPEECKAYSDHMMKLAELNERGEAIGPPLTPAMAKMAIAECPRWLTKKRYDCVMAAPSPMGIMQCPP